jgi:hypothetical protein
LAEEPCTKERFCNDSAPDVVFQIDLAEHSLDLPNLSIDTGGEGLLTLVNDSALYFHGGSGSCPLMPWSEPLSRQPRQADLFYSEDAISPPFGGEGIERRWIFRHRFDHVSDID